MAFIMVKLSPKGFCSRIYLSSFAPKVPMINS